MEQQTEMMFISDII